MKITALETIRLVEFPNILGCACTPTRASSAWARPSWRAAAVEAYLHEIGRAAAARAATRSRSRRAPRDLTAISASAARASRRAATRRSTSRCGTCSARPPASRSTSCWAARAATRIRTYNTCAGYQYIRGTASQTVGQLGPAATASGPYEDLEGFLHRADELAQSLLEQGITGMKIWPFDLGGRSAADGQYISPPTSTRRWSRSARSARRSATGWTSWSSSTRCGSLPTAHQHRPRARAVRHLLARGPDPDGQPRPT